MRIAVVEPVGRGGLAHYACQLARAMARQGAEVTLVTDRSFELERVAAPAAVAPSRAIRGHPSGDRHHRFAVASRAGDA